MSVNFFKKIIHLFRLHWVLVVAHGIFSCGMHVGSSSPTRDQTLAPLVYNLSFRNIMPIGLAYPSADLTRIYEELPGEKSLCFLN